MAKKRVFSGIQPSGEMHLGNYLGAILNWVQGQDEKESIFCIVDEHAITVPQDAADLKKRILDVAKTYLAAGIDPEKSAIFVQSSRPEHAELGWILNNFTYMGELLKMTQFKDKSGGVYGANYYNDQLAGKEWDTEELKVKQAEVLNSIKSGANVSVGLFDYPVLMAADILLYDTDEVPVGEDQKQHVEITRDIAERVNKRYKDELLKLPVFTTNKAATRIMSLTDPTKKMSKSDENPKSRIEMMDTAEVIRKKFASAVTDSGSEIKFDKEKKPGISNLLNILSACTEESVSVLEKKYKGKTYGEFKKDVAEAVIALLEPFQARYNELSDVYVTEILRDGANQVAPTAKKTLARVKKAIGLGI